MAKLSPQPKNAFAKLPEPKGQGSSINTGKGPQEDRADMAGDPMRPKSGPSKPASRSPVGGGVDIATPRPSSQTGRTQAAGSNAGGSRDMPMKSGGAGHMGDWADKEHPVK
jgi:hypothetical protein